MQIVTIERNVPGHYILADRCGYFRHTDISTSDDERDTVYCVSSIGERAVEWPISLYTTRRDSAGNLYELININTIYEVMVFDKRSENPWREIEEFRSNNKWEIEQRHREFVQEYQVKAQNRTNG